MNEKAKCPDCGEAQLFSTEVSSCGGYGPVLLPGLNSWLRSPKFEVVVCARCGLTRFYADEKARVKLSSTKQWKRVSA